MGKESRGARRVGGKVSEWHLEQRRSSSSQILAVTDDVITNMNVLYFETLGAAQTEGVGYFKEDINVVVFHPR